METRLEGATGDARVAKTESREKNSNSRSTN